MDLAWGNRGGGERDFSGLGEAGVEYGYQIGRFMDTKVVTTVYSTIIALHTSHSQTLD